MTTGTYTHFAANSGCCRSVFADGILAQRSQTSSTSSQKAKPHIWPFEYPTAHVGICADPVSHSRPGSVSPNQARIEQETLRSANSLRELVPYWEHTLRR
jgi:hypothetical protein